MRVLLFFFCFFPFLSISYEINPSICEISSEKIDQGKSNCISEIYFITEILKKLEQEGPNSLIIFDIDEVLITSKDGFFHPAAEEFLLSLVKQEMSVATSEEEKKQLEDKLSLSLIKTERILLEEASPGLLKMLKQRGVKTIALTSFPTGRFGKIPLLEKWRIDHLKSLDLDFSVFFPAVQRHEFFSIAKSSIPAPLFQEGILFSRGYTKSEVLLAFLDFIKWKPSKVIFIEDAFENLEGVGQSLKARGIPFEGFYYRGAIPISNQVDKELIEFQFRNLIKHNEWLCDEKAKKRLKEK